MEAKLIRAIFLQKKSGLYNSLGKIPFLKSTRQKEEANIREELWPIKFSFSDKIKTMLPKFIAQDKKEDYK